MISILGTMHTMCLQDNPFNYVRDASGLNDDFPPISFGPSHHALQFENTEIPFPNKYNAQAKNRAQHNPFN